MPAVSIIMGVYNCADTLQSALDSLFNQTFQDFEIIICDDGSRDTSYQIAIQNQLEHPNIVLLQNEENLGLNTTLNRCLASAKGRYIARMDGDDISLPTRLEIEYDFLESHPEYDIVCTSQYHFDDNGIFRQSYRSGEPSRIDFVKGTPFAHTSCMVRKEAYDAVNGYTVSDRLLRVEDYHLWLKMFVKGFRGYRLSRPLYMIRDDEKALSRRTFMNRKNEAYVKCLVCRELKLPFYYHIYCLRPFLVWMLPKRFYLFLHRNAEKIFS